jgi:hypothetical protein
MPQATTLTTKEIPRDWKHRQQSALSTESALVADDTIARSAANDAAIHPRNGLDSVRWVLTQTL